MVTLYDLLEVNENAQKEQIEEAYRNLLLEYAVNPNASEEENKENEMILNKLKMAYEILINDEKRKKYDDNLSKKRAEDLIKNVTVEKPKVENIKEEVPKVEKEPEVKQEIEPERYTATQNNINTQNTATPKEEYYEDNEEADLSRDEKKQVRKAAEEEFKANLKKAQKAEEEYNQAYNEAYNNYLRKMGYDVKEPLTWKKIKAIIIVVFVTILVCFVAWMIPPVRKILIDIYEENFIIKALVDIVIALVGAIFSIFKK